MEKHTCYKCFNEYEGSGPCPVCGYDAAQDNGKYPLALRPGTILDGRYIVGKVLGQGGFGISYLAKDYNSKMLVAIKEHFPSAMVTRMEKGHVRLINENQAEAFLDGKNKFLDEAKTLSQFNGLANICDIYSYFEENGTAYFAMEYVDGVALDDYINRHGGRLSESEALSLLRPVMSTLANVHSKGIIHRDIAPDNILVRPDGSPVLIDFGAARYSMGEKSQSLDVILKHGFAPKEQYARHGRQGAYTDVYALAATLYYCLTGTVPPDAVERAVADELEKPSKLGVKLSATLESALLHALAVDYEKRIRTMPELEQAIFAPASSAKKKPYVLIALLALVVLAAVAFLMMGREPAAIEEPAPSAETMEAPTPTPEASPEPTAMEEPLTDNLVWELSADGTLYISGEGDMLDYSQPKPAPWLKENKNAIKQVVVSEGVTSIGNMAFYDCTKLYSVTLPSTLKRIGDSAFENCWELTSPTLPAGLETIGSRSFKSCRAFGSITLPASVQTMGSRAFEDCENIGSMTLPEGMSRLEDRCFFSCRMLSSVSLPLSLEYIGSEAFNKCESLSYVSYAGSAEAWEKVEVNPSGNLVFTKLNVNCYG